MVNALVETGTLELCERLEVVEWLGITPIFQDLEGPILTRLAGLFQLVECGADVALCEAGRPPDSFWIIVHGRVHISRPSDWDEGCREVARYFATNPIGGQEWKPWANYDFDPPAASM